MKKLACLFVLAVFGFMCFAQEKAENTLLWKISGKNLKSPSYLFGTIHMICGNDIQLSDSLKSAIRQSDKVYLELDMDNIFELMSIITKMKMKGDTTLADLLTAAEYEKVKAFFKSQKTLLPFSMLETYKPMVAASTLLQASMDCDDAISMEQLIMQEAKSTYKKINGLETMSYQMSIFDSIPYKLQAKQLYEYVNNYGKEDNKEFEELSEAYRKQQLSKLESLTKKEDLGMERFSEILLYQRNTNWVNKLKDLLPNNTLVIAVGAGHLPGERGVINLLKKAGYKVEPVKNDMTKKLPVKEM
ncbi:MAG: TraB/GumN family protein [Chitinophagaceae bacterium]